MISDAACNIVYISDLVPGRHPGVSSELARHLGTSLRFIAGAKDIWCRDYMPVQVSQERFVQFRYYPDYMLDRPDLRTANGAGLLPLANCRRSELVIDGGNVVVLNHTAIVTDKIFRENRGIGRKQLRGQLRELLEIDRLIEIPREPYDPIGHADGMVRFVNEETVLVNDYSRINPKFAQRLAKALEEFKQIPFPYFPTGKRIDGIDSAVGVYINYLHIRGRILTPVFDQHADDQALNQLAKVFPGVEIIPINSTELAEGGGVLNCSSWSVTSISS